MGKDKYSDFRTLSDNETLNRDYKIRYRDIGSQILICAPHGGLIEPKTSLIAKLIASDTFNYYCFEGIKKKNNKDLHITSSRFDEPVALRLISSSDIIITIHACTDKDKIIHVGGRFKTLAVHIQGILEKLNIKNSRGEIRFPGTHPDNICNLGSRKKGIQLEFSRGLRDNPRQLILISDAIRKALMDFKF